MLKSLIETIFVIFLPRTPFWKEKVRYWGECIDREQPEVNRRALVRFRVQASNP